LSPAQDDETKGKETKSLNIISLLSLILRLPKEKR